MEDVKDPDACSVFRLYSLLASEEESEVLAARYREGGMGYGEAKQELFEVFEREISPIRERYETLMEKPEDLKTDFGRWCQKSTDTGF